MVWKEGVRYRQDALARANGKSQGRLMVKFIDVVAMSICFGGWSGV
jgi:hypothetical protein